MRTETRVVHIGENVGPIDWGYDFASWGWNRGGSCNPELIPDAVAALRKVEAAHARGERCRVYLYGNEHEVIDVGMYDGWPYWKPTPSVLVKVTLGVEWHSWFSIKAARLVGAEETL